jgi:hypothetical protein
VLHVGAPEIIEHLRLRIGSQCVKGLPAKRIKPIECGDQCRGLSLQRIEEVGSRERLWLAVSGESIAAL